MNIGDKKVWLIEQGNLVNSGMWEGNGVHFVWHPYGDRLNNFKGIGKDGDEAINKLYNRIKHTLFLECND